MKKITFLMAVLSIFAVGVLNAQTVKKETKKQQITRLEQQNEALQHKVDSLSAVADEMELKLAREQDLQDSLLGVRIALELQNRDLQIENYNKQQQIDELQLKLEDKKKQESAKQTYIKNKQYYPDSSKKICEDISLCSKWADDMAKRYGKDFRIIDIVKKENYKDESYTTREIAYGVVTSNGNPIVNTVRHELYDMTSNVIIKYSLNNNILSKMLQCTTLTSSTNDKVCNEYTWVE